MILSLTIDTDKLPSDAAAEAGRILRYWAGALGQLDLTASASYPLMDSEYNEVGTLEIREGGD